MGLDFQNYYFHVCTDKMLKAGLVFQCSVCTPRTPGEAAMLGECAHEWRAYEGFTERYDYCVKCDVKAK